LACDPELGCDLFLVRTALSCPCDEEFAQALDVRLIIEIADVHWDSEARLQFELNPRGQFVGLGVSTEPARAFHLASSPLAFSETPLRLQLEAINSTQSPRIIGLSGALPARPLEVVPRLVESPTFEPGTATID
jgi:hypothetical protein